MDPRTAEAQRDELFYLDVREPHEWAAGRIDGSHHLPMDDLGARQDELPRDRPILAVCRSGRRSQLVTDALVRAGYEAHNLDGGVIAWRADGLPLVTDDGGEGVVA
ncbi:rhodanese-like domain-containing protein [Nitriliruptoraceae bacterium ZYF776]|nr:rhodanese-like domain-containing protein [Profundirhabdus halotolerans]